MLRIFKPFLDLLMDKNINKNIKELEETNYIASIFIGLFRLIIVFGLSLISILVAINDTYNIKTLITDVLLILFLLMWLIALVLCKNIITNSAKYHTDYKKFLKTKQFDDDKIEIEKMLIEDEREKSKFVRDIFKEQKIHQNKLVLMSNKKAFDEFKILFDNNVRMIKQIVSDNNLSNSNIIAMKHIDENMSRFYTLQEFMLKSFDILELSYKNFANNKIDLDLDLDKNFDSISQELNDYMYIENNE